MTTRFSIRFAQMLCVLTLLVASGCATWPVTRVNGTVLVPVGQPISNVGVLVLAKDFTPKAGAPALEQLAATLGNSRIHSLFPELALRVPELFSLNGVASQAIRTNAPAGQPIGIEQYDYVLSISPSVASASNGPRPNQFILRAEIWNRQQVTIWKASIILTAVDGQPERAELYKFREAMAYDIAKTLLSQLNSDAVVKLQDGEVRMPKAKASY